MTRRWARERLRDESAITLPEILVALAITGVALAGLAVVVPVSASGIQQGSQVSTATFLAEQMVERVRAAAWTEAPAADCLGISVGDTAPVPTGAACRGAAASMFPDELRGVAGYPHYRRSVRISSCAGTPCAGVTTAGLRLVAVTVAYTPLTSIGVSPQPTTVRLELLVAQQ